MQNYFFIRSDGRHTKISFSEIIYIEGCRNYLRIVTDQGSSLVLLTMKRMEEILPTGLFCRIHKSFIVSLDRVQEFTNETVYLKNKELPIGQLYRGVIERSVTIANENFCKVVRIAVKGNNGSQYAGVV